MITELLDIYREAVIKRDQAVDELKVVVKGSEMHGILTERLRQADKQYQDAKSRLNNALQTTPMAREVFKWFCANSNLS